MSSCTRSVFRSSSSLVALVALSLTYSGCKSGATSVDDGSLTNAIQKQLAGDTALASQPIATVVTAGVATLSGSVGNDAQRAIAARDAASVPGVKEVVNNISLASAQATAPLAAPIPYSAPTTNATVSRPQTSRQPAPIERRDGDRRDNNRREDRRDSDQHAYNQPSAPLPGPQAQPAVQQPAAPAAPTFRTLNIPSGSAIPVRITQTLDSATTQADTTFSGVVASDVLVDGQVAIPAGSNVSGHVDAVQEAGHFRGNSLLTVSLTGITRRGDRIALNTEPYTVSGKGRGVNTAEKTGGGAAVGAVLGGIFGGGKGAAIGAAAGGGLGAGSNAVTRGQQVQIASESVVRFRLAGPITVRVRSDGGQDVRGDGLDRRRNNQAGEPPSN